MLAISSEGWRRIVEISRYVAHRALSRAYLPADLSGLQNAAPKLPRNIASSANLAGSLPKVSFGL